MGNFKGPKQRQSAAKKYLKLPIGMFQQIDMNSVAHPEWMTRAWKNNHYVVMVDDNAKTTAGSAIRVMVQKHDGLPIPMHWSQMQKIKNDLFGKETVAVEYYPKESELVDAANIYWFWIYPEGILPIPIQP